MHPSNNTVCDSAHCCQQWANILGFYFLFCYCLTQCPETHYKLNTGAEHCFWKCSHFVTVTDVTCDRSITTAIFRVWDIFAVFELLVSYSVFGVFVSCLINAKLRTCGNISKLSLKNAKLPHCGNTPKLSLKKSKTPELWEHFQIELVTWPKKTRKWCH